MDVRVFTNRIRSKLYPAPPSARHITECFFFRFDFIRFFVHTKNNFLFRYSFFCIRAIFYKNSCTASTGVKVKKKKNKNTNEFFFRIFFIRIFFFILITYKSADSNHKTIFFINILNVTYFLANYNLKKKMKRIFFNFIKTRAFFFLFIY